MGKPRSYEGKAQPTNEPKVSKAVKVKVTTFQISLGVRFKSKRKFIIVLSTPSAVLTVCSFHQILPNGVAICTIKKRNRITHARPVTPSAADLAQFPVGFTA